MSKIYAARTILSRNNCVFKFLMIKEKYKIPVLKTGLVVQEQKMRKKYQFLRAGIDRPVPVWLAVGETGVGRFAEGASVFFGRHAFLLHELLGEKAVIVKARLLRHG